MSGEKETTAVKIDAFLYDASGTDERVELEDVDVSKLDENKLLWVSIIQRERGAIEQVCSRLKLGNIPASLRIDRKSVRPRMHSYGSFFHFSIISVVNSESGSPEKMPIDFLVGKNYVIAIHEGPVDYFVDFQKRDFGETHFGELDAESFVATLLDLHIVSYFRALDAIEKRVDKLDALVLRRELETDEFLERMVALRNDVSKLRRWLVPHREVIYGFLRPDFQRISESDSLDVYKTISNHYENAVDAIETSRETVLGVFDLYATKSAQLMNIFIQRLTYLTLVTGSLSVIAGVLGMNYKVDFFDSPSGFWVTIGGMLIITAGMTIYARFRRWI